MPRPWPSTARRRLPGDVPAAVEQGQESTDTLSADTAVWSSKLANAGITLDLATPDGQALFRDLARTADVVRLVLERHPTDTVVMVGHDSVNRAILMQFLDQPLSAYGRLAQDPGTLNEVDVDGDDIRVRRINDTSHLD